METSPAQSQYPYAEFSVECPQKSDRVTAFFRPFCALPIGILFVLLVGTSAGKGAVVGGGFLFFPVLLMIVFRNRYPRVWFDWMCYLSKFAARVGSYFFLLRDEYPSVDDEQAVKLGLRYPDVAGELHRAMPLFKWFLAIPHFVVLVFLFLAVIIVTIIAWFAILFTGKYPPGLHSFVVSVLRWSLRVNAYAFLLLTDRYPPFSMQ